MLSGSLSRGEEWGCRKESEPFLQVEEEVWVEGEERGHEAALKGDLGEKTTTEKKMRLKGCIWLWVAAW